MAPAPPLHAFGPPSADEWAREFGGPRRLAIVVAPQTWGWALEGRTELRLATDERDAALATLAAKDNEIAALRSHVASLQGRIGVLTVQLEAAEAWKLERQSRASSWKVGGWTLAIGLVVGVVADDL